MKKGLFGALALALMIPLQAKAVGGVGLELGYAPWSSSTTGTVNVTSVGPTSSTPNLLWAEFEHPIPLVPNLRIAKSSIAVGDTTNGIFLDSTDIIVYYNLLDTGATIDVGAGLRILSGDFYLATALTAVPAAPVPVIHLNLASEIPALGLTVGYRYSGLSAQGQGVASSEVYANYEITAGLNVTAGTRDQNINITSGQPLNIDSNGIFIGVMYKLD